MPWVRLDDDYFTHRKTAALSKDARLLDLAGITYAARELRDGVLTQRDVRVVAAQVDVLDTLHDCLSELERVGRWRPVDKGAWEIHDFLEYNLSRDQVLKEREGAADRMRTMRSRRYAVTEGVTGGVTQSAPDPLYVNDKTYTDTDTSRSTSPARAGAREIDPSRLCSACSTTLPRRRPTHGLCADCHGRALINAKAAHVDVMHISLEQLTEFARHD